MPTCTATPGPHSQQIATIALSRPQSRQHPQQQPLLLHQLRVKCTAKHVSEQYPLVTIGKVFFTQNRTRYVASAFSIGNYAIMTAGHVVHAGNGSNDGWSENLVFVPAYRDNARPRGTWAASWLATRTRWFNDGNPGGLWEDIGGAVLHPVNGQRISQAVGWLGFSWNWPRTPFSWQHWRLETRCQARS